MREHPQGGCEILGPDKFSALIPECSAVALIRDALEILVVSQHQKLPEGGLFCGDGVFFGLDGEKPFMLLTDFPNNPLMKAPEKSERLLAENRYFIQPSEAKALEALAQSGNGAVKIDLTGLKLVGSQSRHVLEINYSALVKGLDEAVKQYGETHEIVKACIQAIERTAVKQYGDSVNPLLRWILGKSPYGPDGLGAKLLKAASEQGSKDEIRFRVSFPRLCDFRYILHGQNAGILFGRASKIHRDYWLEIYLDAQHLDIPACVYGKKK
ncbi:hypothetical protein HYV84_01615 [Candidatus Woesearchaeota archaeon]|nr:hypothetical protein [Candidatus Woesearchaeota archaeon]